MDTHHHCTDRTTRLEQQDPRTVNEQHYPKSKFHGVSEGADKVYTVVQLLPESTPVGDKKKERVDGQRDEDLKSKCIIRKCLQGLTFVSK